MPTGIVETSAARKRGIKRNTKKREHRRELEWRRVEDKINMYKAEILGKLPVIKQFLFRPILPYEGPPPHKQVASAHAENIPTKDGGTVSTYLRQLDEVVIAWKIANLFEKYERVQEEEFEAFEQLRKERNEKIREDLLSEARKDVDKLVANREGLLKKGQKDVNGVAAGEVTRKMVEKYERTLQEDVEADEDMRKECNEEMIQKLLKEAREEIESLVTSVKRKVGFDEKYEQTLRGDF
ncbi:hypothetical protein EDD17DRAFT_1892283 [Pisolithus thermaeus]|nr:hypothetical protein EDD17DRAFT_1892283 [Pisolithus thermaeus]